MRLAPVLVCLAAGLAHADETPTPEPAPTAVEAKLAALQAQIDELKATADAQLEAANSADAQPSFRIYGFIDMGLQKLWAPADPTVPTTKTTFVLGNVNLYFDFHPHPDWSSLIEVRFTNYPNGAEQYGIPVIGRQFDRTSTAVQDPGNGDGSDTVSWGSIVLERAYIQWQHDPRFGIRVGQFLTPYGIWNVDHGTPTLISLYRPKFQSNQMFPEHQLGIDGFGTVTDTPLDHWTLDWDAYLSNGRTPGQVSLTDDKTYGGRLQLSTTRPYRMAFGLSAMRGHYLDQQRELDSITEGIVRETTVDEEDTAVGVDASFDLGALRLRWEAALRIRDFAEDHRAQAWLPGIYVADGYEADSYLLAAYRIGHTKLEPYLYGEAYRWPSPFGDLLLTGSVGVNYYFTPAIQLKAQLSHSDWRGGTDGSLGSLDDDGTFLAAKLVMGF